MADKNQLKIADQVDLADDDPFAELTRIMGFDPRQPAKQAQAPQPAAVEQAAEEDDFSLDLEKELLGGFDLEDEFSESGAPIEAAASVDEMLAAASEPEASAAEAPEVDFDFSADFDAAMAASTEEAAAGHDGEFDLGLTEDDVRALDAEGSQSAAPAEAEVDFDFGLTEDDVRALDVEDSQSAAPAEAEVDFDFGLTEDDVRALDAETFQPAAPVEAAPAVDASADDRDIDADLDAAMADIDMDFLRDTAAPEPVVAALADEAPETLQEETADAGETDLHLFDEDDFRFEDDAAPAVEPEPEPEPQPELDESAFSFDEGELRLDDATPAEEQSAQPAAEELSFDDVDFTVEDFSAEPEVVELEVAEPETVAAAEPQVEPESEPSLSVQAEPDLAPRFELPRYEPRKLPVSPMDVAAEEFRQREATAAPAEPEFNLEDELNALLGNIRANQAATTDAAPEPESALFSAPAYEPPAFELPAYESPAFEPPAYEPPADFHQSAAPSAYETSAYEAGRPAAEPRDVRASEPISFDPPEHPVDIEDNLNWELDDVFAADAELEQVEDEQPVDGQAETYAEDDQPETYAEDRQYGAYAEADQPEDDYAAEEPALDFDDDAYDQPAEDAAQQAPSTYYGDALAGAAIGAASRFDSGFAARPFEASASQRLSELPRTPASTPDRFAERPQAAAEAFSPHRDPVVRGNPLKEDPLDIITALAAKYSKKEPITPYGRAMGVAAGTASFGEAAAEDEDIDISAAFEEQPEVETVEVADRAVALADDLDIPELAEEEELPPVSAYDDLDAEFSSLLSDMNAEPRAAQPANSYDDSLDGGFDAHPYQTGQSAPRHAAQPARKAYDDDPEPDSFALDADELPGSRMPSGAQYAADEYDYDPDLDQEIAAPHHLAAESRQMPKSRGMLLAALVGGVALVGAIGAFALSFGDGSGGDTPAIVRADDSPVKVKPENPGGSTVPNQDNKVYDTVAGEGAADAPQQEKLVTTAEEPVDVTPPPPAMEETAAAPSGKSEDRIEQILDEAENQTDAEIVAVSPRKVRTMVVKPDGTLVEREGEPESPSNEQTDTVAAAVPGAGPAPAIPESTGALPATPETAEAEAAPPPAMAAAPEETTAAAPPPAEEEALPPAQEQIAAAEPASEDRGAMPETAPIAPLRPADQPIDVVGEVKPDQVAAATTAAAPGGNWAMQIASQPSEAAAQSSYQDLARRYGGVLEGREVNIVKAEIAGKGTFWRVRVPAGSRNEAIGLCENYKAAGGNCFVSR